MRIDIRRIEALKQTGEIIGNRTRAKIVKNKVAPPFREAEFDIMYGKGISHEGELVDLGLKFDILKRSGAWFYYGETRIGQGRDNVKQLLIDNKELAAEIEEKLINAMNGVKTEEPVALAPQEDTEIKPRKKINIDIAVDE